jgi:hypothetical protein
MAKEQQQPTTLVLPDGQEVEFEAGTRSEVMREFAQKYMRDRRLYGEDWRSKALATLPAAGATAGGIIGQRFGGPRGAAGGGGMGTAAGRTLERVGRQALRVPPARGVVERMITASGGEVPGPLSGVLDVGEQALGGAALEGIPAKLFGVPGKVAGSVESRLSGVAQRQAAKAEAGAARKAREVAVAREAGPETEAALASSRATREASSARAAQTIAAAAGRPGAPVFNVNKIADRMMQRNPRAYTDRNELVDALHKQIDEVSREVHGVSERRFRFDLADLQHLKQGFDQFESTAREAAAAGRGRVSGLAVKAADAMRSLIDDAVPSMRAINAETKQALKAERKLQRFAALQPTGEVAAIRAGQQERTAATLARQALDESAFQPRLSMRGIDVSTPHVARLAGSAARFLGRPGVSGTGRYGGDVLNLLLRLTGQQPMEDSEP